MTLRPQVLDLMVRMLGFSEEDKQRIGFAQQTSGRSVVRGVLGLPGRLVGGIMGGGSSQEKPGHAAMDNEVYSSALTVLLVEPFFNYFTNRKKEVKKKKGCT